MTGLVELDSGIYAFRNDTGFSGFFAWNIHDNVVAGHITTHKWPKLPKGIVTEFDIDDPPKTVGYLPILAPFL